MFCTYPLSRLAMKICEWVGAFFLITNTKIMKRTLFIILTLFFVSLSLPSCQDQVSEFEKIKGKWTPVEWPGSMSSRVNFKNTAENSGDLYICGFSSEWVVAEFVVWDDEVILEPVDSQIQGRFKITEVWTDFHSSGEVSDGRLVLVKLDENRQPTEVKWTFER